MVATEAELKPRTELTPKQERWRRSAIAAVRTIQQDAAMLRRYGPTVRHIGSRELRKERRARVMRLRRRRGRR